MAPSLLVNTRSPKSHPLDISNPLPVSTVSYVRGGLGTATCAQLAP